MLLQSSSRTQPCKCLMVTFMNLHGVQPLLFRHIFTQLYGDSRSPFTKCCNMVRQVTACKCVQELMKECTFQPKTLWHMRSASRAPRSHSLNTRRDPPVRRPHRASISTDEALDRSAADSSHVSICTGVTTCDKSIGQRLPWPWPSRDDTSQSTPWYESAGHI